MKKLLFDINSIVSYFTHGYGSGISRSTMELLNALEHVDNIPFEIILYSQNTKGIGTRNLHTKFHKLHIWWPNRPNFNNIINTLKLKHLLSDYDILHIPHNTDKWEYIHKTCYTIHDLIVYRYPQMWGLTNREREQHKYIAQNCRAITTCSQASKNDIIKYWNIPDEKITVIPWGLNRSIFSPKECLETQYNYFFSAACNHPRKNTILLLESFKNYLNCGGQSNLILLNPLREDLINYTDLIRTNRLKIVNNISESELVELYNHAKASIVTSLYEGFGFPVLESLGCHTQVICAKNSSLTEAGGDIVDYLETLSPDELTEKLLYYDSIKKSESIDINKTEEHLNKFTWQKCAKKYIDFWIKIL